jgi:RecA/RadA recombinase
MINVALSGTVNGGLYPGMTMLAGPSKHFKTAFALLMASSFLQDNPDGIILFYDSEFGTPASYVTSFGIDPNKIVHTPITDIEVFKFDIMQQLDNLNRGDKVLIMVDSIGNLASRKEVEDTLKGKSVADMSRAKQLKSVFRMVTPHLAIKHIPMVVVNHTYKEIAMFPKDIVSGGTGSYYSADNIWIIGRQQDAEQDGGKKVLNGYNFIINIEKSRYVKEKSKIPVNVTFENGINRWSGLLDIAVDLGYLIKGKKGNAIAYSLVDKLTGEVAEETYKDEELRTNGEFWKSMFKTSKFADDIADKYRLSVQPIMGATEVE